MQHAPLRRLGEHFPSGNLSLLQQLLEHIRMGGLAGGAHGPLHTEGQVLNGFSPDGVMTPGTPAPGGVPHGFGPGGAVSPASPGSPRGDLAALIAGQHGFAAPPGYAAGVHDPAVWMKRHPGAMAGRAQLPGWMAAYMAAQARQAQGQGTAVNPVGYS